LGSTMRSRLGHVRTLHLYFADQGVTPCASCWLRFGSSQLAWMQPPSRLDQPAANGCLLHAWPAAPIRHCAAKTSRSTYTVDKSNCCPARTLLDPRLAESVGEPSSLVAVTLSDASQQSLSGPTVRRLRAPDDRDHRFCLIATSQVRLTGSFVRTVQSWRNSLGRCSSTLQSWLS
jgi:hypothetical protein